MCNAIHKENSNELIPNEDSGIAYKVFAKKGNRLLPAFDVWGLSEPEYRTFNGEVLFTDSLKSTRELDMSRETHGFCIMLSLEDADKLVDILNEDRFNSPTHWAINSKVDRFVVRKVKYRDCKVIREDTFGDYLVYNLIIAHCFVPVFEGVETL